MKPKLIHNGRVIVTGIIVTGNIITEDIIIKVIFDVVIE